MNAPRPAPQEADAKKLRTRFRVAQRLASASRICGEQHDFLARRRRRGGGGRRRAASGVLIALDDEEENEGDDEEVDDEW